LKIFEKKLKIAKNNKNQKNMFLMSLRQLQRLFLCDQLLTRLFKSTLMLLFFQNKIKIKKIEKSKFTKRTNVKRKKLKNQIVF
jgi:hypothetical protein